MNKKAQFIERQNRKHAITFKGQSMTKQSFRQESNINNIMKKYERTGLLEHVNERQARFGDFADIPDFQTALNQIHEAQMLFDDLPAAIRKKFQNDPVEFVEFAQNPENEDQMIEMGLLPPKPSVSPSNEPNLNNDDKLNDNANKTQGESQEKAQT